MAVPSATSPRRRDRVTYALVSLATLMGLWLGLTAPSVSPVAAQPPVMTAPAAAVDQQAPVVQPFRGGSRR
ncbi:MAG: hypothetical protein ACXVFV_01040 [Mycobacteriales bacterium]